MAGRRTSKIPGRYKMMITFVRHAEKEGEGEDPPLTKKGVKQATYLAQRFKKEHFDEIYCSALVRTQQTAKPLLKGRKLTLQIEPALNEFNAEMLKEEKKHWTKKEKQRHKALLSFLDHLTKHPTEEKHILIIGHGITNRFILAHFFDLPAHKLMGLMQYETGVNKLVWNERFNNWRLARWNDSSHLPEKLVKGRHHTAKE